MKQPMRILFWLTLLALPAIIIWGGLRLSGPYKAVSHGGKGTPEVCSVCHQQKQAPYLLW